MIYVLRKKRQPKIAVTQRLIGKKKRSVGYKVLASVKT